MHMKTHHFFRLQSVRTFWTLGAALVACGLVTPVLGQFPGGGFQGGGGNRNAGNSGGLQAATQVTAVADEYSNSLIILAPENYQLAISNLVAQLDVPVEDITELRVFPLMNSDPTEMAQVLTSLFPDSSTSANTGRGPGFMFGGRGNAAASSANSSERSKRQSKVLAVADPRTSSVIVSASKDLMEQIVPMIQKLDESSSKKQKVFVYSLENADSADVETVLKNLFETQNTRNGRTTQNNQQNNALSQRQNNSARNQGTTAPGFGNSTGVGGGLRGGQ